MMRSFAVAVSAREAALGRIARERAKGVITSAYFPFVLILMLQTLVSVTTLRNTAFQDEGLYLYAGRQLFRHMAGGPAPLENYAFYFSGYPYAYPLLGGILDIVGGLELARWFSLFCMMGVNGIIYLSTRKFFLLPAAIFASATYACVGSVLFLGRLATFDAVCLFLIALATGISLHVSQSRRFWLAIVVGPLLVLAVLAKYAALVFVLPVLSILAVSVLTFQVWRRALYCLAIALFTLLMSLIITLIFIDRSAFHAIDGSTTNRTALMLTSRPELLFHVLEMGGIVYAAALLGLILVFRHHPRFRLLGLFLFAASWLMPMYHIYKQEAVSLDKHIAYGIFFVAPLAGYALATLSGFVRQTSCGFSRLSRFSGPSGARGWSWPVGLAVVLMVFTMGMRQSQAIYAQWANTTTLSYILHTQMRDGSGRYLIEDIEVARYDAKDVTEPWQWNGVQYFYYDTASGHQLLGEPALTQAIEDRYFALVELSFVAHPDEAYFIAQTMATTMNYDLIARVGFQNSFGTGYYYVWRSALAPGHGNFTSLSQVLPPPPKA